MRFQMIDNKREKEEIARDRDNELNLRDLSYPEVEEIKNNNPDLYDEMIKNQTIELEEQQKELENTQPVSAIDEVAMKGLYEKEDDDYMKGQY